MVSRPLFSLTLACLLESGKLVAEKGIGSCTQTRLVENDFPYFFESNVGHYILWKIGTALEDSDVNHAAQSLSKQLQVWAE
jgi:hypothetical protein